MSTCVYNTEFFSGWEARNFVPGSLPLLIGLRDPLEHTQRRKIWNHAFTSESVKDYEGIIAKRALELAAHVELQSRQDSTVNIAKWITYFAYELFSILLR